MSAIKNLSNILFADRSQPKPLMDEVATTQKDYDLFMGYFGKVLINPDPVLYSEGGSLGVKLYDQIARDPHAASVLQTRYLSVAGLEYDIIPAEDGPRRGRPNSTTKTKNQEIADFVRNVLENCNFTQGCFELLQGILYGYFCSEIMWKVNENSQIVIDKFVSKHARRFTFTIDREPRLLTITASWEGEELPPKKFVVFQYGDTDNPFGKGLGQVLYWPVWFKKHGIKFWMIFLEKYGSPTAIGKYPKGAGDAQKEKLKDALYAIQQETGIVIPEGMEISLLEATRAGAVSYMDACDFFDRQISKAVLGQTLTTEIGKTGGANAAAQTHDGVRQDIIKADADILADVLNHSVIPWLVDFNFANVTAYPKLWFRTEQEIDLNAQILRDEKLSTLISIGTQYFYDTYGIPVPEDGEAVVEKTEPAVNPFGGGGGHGFAESGTQIEKRMDEMENKLKSSINMRDIVGPVQKLVGEATTLEGLRAKLDTLPKAMDVEGLKTDMEKAILLAQLAGRADVANTNPS